MRAPFGGGSKGNLPLSNTCRFGRMNPMRLSDQKGMSGAGEFFVQPLLPPYCTTSRFGFMFRPTPKYDIVSGETPVLSRSTYLSKKVVQQRQLCALICESGDLLWTQAMPEPKLPHLSGGQSGVNTRVCAIRAESL